MGEGPFPSFVRQGASLPAAVTTKRIEHPRIGATEVQLFDSDDESKIVGIRVECACGARQLSPGSRSQARKWLEKHRQEDCAVTGTYPKPKRSE